MINKKIINIMIIILLMISLFSAGILIAYAYSLKQAEKDLDELAETFQANQEKLARERKKEEDKDGNKDGIEEKIVEKAYDMTMAFEDLYERNSDIAGWLYIPNTKLNYPLMYTPKNPEYYLYRNFDKKYSRNGIPFIDGRVSLDVDKPSDNILIHSHNMRNGTMFSLLLDYKDEEFFKAHPSIELYTLEGKRIFDIIAVFSTDVYDKNAKNSDYQSFIEAANKDEFDKYVADVKGASLFDTGISAEYGDQLMTLSTCAYHTKHGRFAVVAKERQVEEEQEKDNEGKITSDNFYE